MTIEDLAPVSRPRVVFMGTPEFAVPALREVARRCEIAAVLTPPDRPRGRGRRTAPSAVALAAEELGLNVLKADTMKSEELRERVAALGADLFAVVAFGAILSRAWLKTPRLGSINLHGSLLPEYRGASPVQRALWDGRAATGVTTMWIDEGLDTGDRILQRWTPIEASDDAGTLAARLATLGAPLLADSLVLAAGGAAPRHPQPSPGTYAKKLVKQDGVVDFALDAATVWNRQRAVTPWPGATTACERRRLLVIECRPHDLLPANAPPGTVLEVGAHAVRVACGTGAVDLVKVKPEGRGAMAAADWARGARVAHGARLEWAPEWTEEGVS